MNLQQPAAPRSLLAASCPSEPLSSQLPLAASSSICCKLRNKAKEKTFGTGSSGWISFLSLHENLSDYFHSTHSSNRPHLSRLRNVTGHISLPRNIQPCTQLVCNFIISETSLLVSRGISCLNLLHPSRTLASTGSSICHVTISVY